jgi:hypothetical protein
MPRGQRKDEHDMFQEYLQDEVACGGALGFSRFIDPCERRHLIRIHYKLHSTSGAPKPLVCARMLKERYPHWPITTGKLAYLLADRTYCF